MSNLYSPKDKALHDNFYKATPEQQRSYAKGELEIIIKARANSLWANDCNHKLSLTKAAEKITKAVREDLTEHIEFVYPEPEPFRLKTKHVRSLIRECCPEYALDYELVDIDYETPETPNISIGLLAPEEMKKYFYWVVALDAWDYCNSEPLSKLMRHHAVPEVLRPIIAKIISGERKQKSKANTLKVPAGHRLLYISAIMGLEFIASLPLRNAIIVTDDNGDRIHESNLSMMATREGVEISEIKKEIERNKLQCRNIIANEYNVSQYTIKDLKKILKDKVNQWPDL